MFNAVKINGQTASSCWPNLLHIREKSYANGFLKDTENDQLCKRIPYKLLLSPIALSRYRLSPIHFEKDNRKLGCYKLFSLSLRKPLV